MKNSYELGQDQFDALLGLFSADRDEAGEKYEQIRRGLVRFFQFKGCQDPDTLADDTINRVALKAADFDPSKNIKPVSYVYGFASNVFLEHRRTANRETSLGETQFRSPENNKNDEPDDMKTGCLNECLEKLPFDDRTLIVDYYSLEGRKKIELRREMCERFECSATALHTKVFRMRAGLRGCITECVKKNL